MFNITGSQFYVISPPTSIYIHHGFWGPRCYSTSPADFMVNPAMQPCLTWVTEMGSGPRVGKGAASKHDAEK